MAIDKDNRISKQECFGPSSDSVYEGEIGMFSKL